MYKRWLDINQRGEWKKSRARERKRERGREGGREGGRAGKAARKRDTVESSDAAMQEGRSAFGIVSHGG